jgi:hypothetical protein
MNVEHDLHRFGLFFVKNVLKNLHDKFLGRVIVIVQQNFVERRTFNLFLGLGDQSVIKISFSPAHGRLARLNLVKSNTLGHGAAILTNVEKALGEELQRAGKRSV